MLKSLKIIIATMFLFILFSISNSVIATNINLDMPDSSTDIENIPTDTYEAVPQDNPTDMQEDITSTTDADIPQDASESLASETTQPEIADGASDTTTSETSTGVSVSSTLPEESLGLTNILNIFLILLGILLVFLGIAILTQVKNK